MKTLNRILNDTIEMILFIHREITVKKLEVQIIELQENQVDDFPYFWQAD